LQARSIQSSIAASAARRRSPAGGPFSFRRHLERARSSPINDYVDGRQHDRDRTKATPEEAKAIIDGSIAYYGTYTVNEADKTITPKLDGSTYANLVGGPEQKRIITSLTADDLKFTNPRTPAGVTLLTIWKRAPAQ
jgi:hypothetical protein